MRNIGVPRRPPMHDPRRSPSPWPIILTCMAPIALMLAVSIAVLWWR
jgi:hypothetical protein